jgi:hypothetical protein
MNIRYQVIFSEKLNFKDILVVIIQESVATLERLNVEAIKNAISIEYVKNLDTKWLVGFNLSLDGEIYSVVSGINDSIKSSEKVVSVIKYFEEALCSDLNQYHKKIFNLEMKLREVITLIFVERYPQNTYNLFSEIEIQPDYAEKSLSKDYSSRERYLKSRLENELFYLLFSDYIKVLNQRKLSAESILHIIQTTTSFNDLKDSIRSRGILKKEHQDFLSSIKEHLNSIELVRNCVAHNRAPSEDELYSYNISIDILEEKLDTFIQILEDETPEELKS